MAYVTMNVRVNDYTRRVLGVIKEKFGLKGKAQALDKFAELYGDDFVEQDVSEETAREVIRTCDEHIKKYGFRKRSLEELAGLCGVKP